MAAVPRTLLLESRQPIMNNSTRFLALVALLAPDAGAAGAHGVVGGNTQAPPETQAVELAQAMPVDRVMGLWEGMAEARDGNTYPFELTLAQWGTQIYGVGVLTVNPANPLFGLPAVRIDGRIEGTTLTLGMSGVLNNECFTIQPSATTAYGLTVVHDPATETLVATRVAPLNPIGCGQLFETFTVARADEPWQDGNNGILGTWDGRVSAPPGWVFTTIPAFHQRKSFFIDSGVGLRGFLEFFPFPGSAWGEMDLTWNPVSQRSTYIYECVPQYVYVGVIDGNKFTGIWKPTDQSNKSFIGVFSHTLQDFFEEPGPLATPCE
jgi:hypothetical protein